MRDIGVRVVIHLSSASPRITTLTPISRGVTLIELVITIVLLGIIGGVSAMVLVPAFESYFASQRRAGLADTADTALRRMARDVRLALPHSARVDASGRFLEILVTKNGGRYRAANDADAGTDERPLDFADAQDAFDTLGALAAGGEQVQAGDRVVIFNLGIPGANAYDTAASPPNIAEIAAVGAGALAAESRITLASPTRFALDSPGRRFFVVSGPVAYACVGVGVADGDGTGTLRRWSNYPIELRGGLPPASVPAGALEAVLADNLSVCELRYTTLPHLSRGLVGVRLAITRRGETVTLFHEIHVNNVP